LFFITIIIIIINAFKCNLKELTTKNSCVASGLGLVWMHVVRTTSLWHFVIIHGKHEELCPAPAWCISPFFFWYFFSFSTVISVWVVPASLNAWHRSSWPGCGIAPAMGALLKQSRGWLPKVKALAPHPHY